MHNTLQISPQKETEKIVSFIQHILKTQGFKNVVIGISGGIDSTTALFLLSKSIPSKNIFPVSMPYFQESADQFKNILNALSIPKQNFHNISITQIVDVMKNNLGILKNEQIRFGNIMARVRMIVLYDLAKKHNALVCGTENKSEHYLGYFTKYGDEASDFEPILHLYKTQIFKLALHLNIPQEIIKKAPSANLWQGQTDEEEFGFTYAEADQVLHLYFDKHKPLEGIAEQGFKNAEKIIKWTKKFEYKHKTPYSLLPTSASSTAKATTGETTPS